MKGSRYFHHYTANLSQSTEQPSTSRQQPSWERSHRPTRERSQGFVELFGDPSESRERGRYQRHRYRTGHQKSSDRYDSEQNYGRRVSAGYGGLKRKHEEDEGYERWNSHRKDRREEEYRRGLGARERQEKGGVEWRNRRFGDDDMPFSSMRQPTAPHIDDNDENRTSLRQRKRVRGGRIPQIKKTQEYTSDSLYCDVCDRFLEDANAKACHDKGKPHRTRLAERRIEEDLAARRREKKPEESPLKKTVMSFTPEEVKAVLAEKKSSAFQEWANRSLAAAKETQQSTGDPNIVMAVMREIVHEFKLHKINSTMFVESWARRPEATGRHYMTTVPTTFKDIVVSEEHAKKMEVQGKANETTEQGTAAEFSVADVSLNGTERSESLSRWVRGETVDQNDRSVSNVTSSVPAVNENCAPSDSMAETPISTTNQVTVAPAESIADTMCENVAVDEPSRRAEITWKLSRAAQRILVSSMNPNEKLVAVRARQIFPVSKPSLQVDEPNEQTTIEKLMEEYNKLLDEFERKVYEYNSWRESVTSVAEELRKRGSRVGTLRGCYQMLASAGITAEDWSRCYTACDELVQMYKWTNDLGEAGFQYVGYWILLSLFKSAKRIGKREPQRPVFSGFLELNSKMRDLPRRAFEDEGVYECWQAWVAVLTNNYHKFFQIMMKGRVHAKTEERSKYIMDELVDVVRERALLTMAFRNSFLDHNVYDGGIANMGYVIKILGWEEEMSDDDSGVDLALEEAREFVEGLPQGIKIGGGAAHGRLGMLLTNEKVAQIRDSNVIDVRTIVWMNRNLWPVCAS